MVISSSNPSGIGFPLFIATERFGPSAGDKWESYCAWAKIPSLREVVSLDHMLCPRIVRELTDEDWSHIVCEDFRLDYFHDCDYLKHRTRGVGCMNFLGLYRNPETHIASPPADGRFSFVGYDLIEEQTQISALTNCGGFPEVFQNGELNCFGLVEGFARAVEIQQQLAEHHPEEPHAQCELYALWRLEEA